MPPELCLPTKRRDDKNQCNVCCLLAGRQNDRNLKLKNDVVRSATQEEYLYISVLRDGAAVCFTNALHTNTF